MNDTMPPENPDISPGPGALTITDRELFERLGWFTHVRWVFGAFCLLMLLIGWHVFGVRFRVDNAPATVQLAVHVVLVVFLYNAVFTFLVRIVRDRGRITRKLIESIGLGQIVCDLIALTALVHYTGGVENAFILLALVPVAIVAELLSRGLAYATAAAAAILLNALAWGEQQLLLPHVHLVFPGGGAGPGRYTDPVHVLHVTAALTVTIFAVVFITTTIAARLRAREAELENAYDELFRTDEAKGLFMRRAEHEIRAPLAAIHSILDALVVDPGALTDAQVRLVGRAKDRTHALRNLVGDLRRYSRLRSGESIFQPRDVCFSDIVIDTVDLFAEQAQSRQLALDSSVTPTWLHGDQEMLRELVTNLVANAVQYTPPGGRVDVTLRHDGKGSVLEVKDTGIGIAAEDKERLFEEFFRATRAKEVFPDGTGLGLAITRRIVRMHRGQIEADSGPRGGTVFTVRLPMARKGKAAGAGSGPPTEGVA